jgi:hypothetical protein
VDGRDEITRRAAFSRNRLVTVLRTSVLKAKPIQLSCPLATSRHRAHDALQWRLIVCVIRLIILSADPADPGTCSSPSSGSAAHDLRDTRVAFTILDVNLPRRCRANICLSAVNCAAFRVRSNGSNVRTCLDDTEIDRISGVAQRRRGILDIS